MIDVIFNDIDGCMVPRDYDPFRIVLDEAASEQHFAYYRAYAGPQIVICTGRGWADTRGILERAQFFPRQRPSGPTRPCCASTVWMSSSTLSLIRTSL